MSRQVKDELDWADFQVRSDVAIRRHQALVNCAFCFCWAAWFARPASPAAPVPGIRRRGQSEGYQGRPAARAAVLAEGDPGRPRLAVPMDRAAALVECMVEHASSRQLQDLMTSLEAGHGLHLYIPNQQTTVNQTELAEPRS